MFNPHRQHHELNKLARPVFVAISPDSTATARCAAKIPHSIFSEQRADLPVLHEIGRLPTTELR